MCPEPRLSSQTRRFCGLIVKNRAHLKQVNKYGTPKGTRDFTDLEKSYILFVSSVLSLSLCLSAFLALSQLPPPPPPSSPLSVVFRFLFSTGRRKEMKRAFAHLSE